mmetsp:Transcript_14604/g.20641  ORF Transcript_14604/g.20641 Transcript_14604/m.20641 type:complete len:225 (+) Transcript_14604:92-766(+)
MYISQSVEKVYSDTNEQSSCVSDCMLMQHEEYSILFDETSMDEMVNCPVVCDRHIDQDDGCDGSSGTDAHVASEKKEITFGKVHVRCYERILGDHPLCRKGPALTFCWTPEADELWDFEEYQKQHHCCRKRSAFRLSADEREEILNDLTQDENIFSGSTQLQALVFACDKQRKFLDKSDKPVIHRRGIPTKHSIQTNRRSTVTRVGRPRMWMPEETSKAPIIGF